MARTRAGGAGAAGAARRPAVRARAAAGWRESRGRAGGHRRTVPAARAAPAGLTLRRRLQTIHHRAPRRALRAPGRCA
ncbi:MAG: hypothetical protein DLM63_02645 [Solirubrobacterales bacterium]|nr:MAG: hypothetical protein DLM63_02645 [Solirubrobacterales bacterium]